MHAVELSADCEGCGLEGGVVEVYDALVPACRFGLPATTRCKLCAATTEGVFTGTPKSPLREIPANWCPACLDELSPRAIDERCCANCGARAAMVERIPPLRFTSITQLEKALDAWAEREKFPTREALASATFVKPEIGEVFGALMHRERIEVLADPFANMGVRTTDGSADQRPAPVRPVPPAALAPTDPVALPLAPPPPSAPPRAIVYPLVSVITADGEVHPEERALVDRFLQSEGLAPLSEHEYRFHHPSEVVHLVPKERREDVVKLMCESATVDGMADESERRVIRAYATAWDVDEEKVAFWMWGYESMNSSLTRALWLKLRRFVLSARWSDSESRG